MNYDTQPLMIGRMRLRSGIKTPSAEEQAKAALISTDDTSNPKPTSSPSKRDPPPPSKRNASPRKRKAGSVEKDHEEVKQPAEVEESEDEMAELEGALSAGEDDDSELEASANEDESDDENDASDGDSEDQDEDEDALHSDDIPSDEEEPSKIPPLKPGQVPGLDPEDMNNGDDDLRNYRVETDANGNEKYVYDEIDPVYDSDDTDANEPVNTIGNIDMKFYDSYPHIGYDINGKKIMRPAAGDALDALLDSIEVPKGWTGLTDPTTGKPLNLSQNELELIKKIQMNELPQDGFNPYPVRPLFLCNASGQ